MLLIKGGPPASIPLDKIGQVILSHNPSFDVRIAWAYYDLAQLFGFDPAALMAQAILETGWFTSDKAVKQHNYAGIGVTALGVTGSINLSPIEGVLEHIAHMVAYAWDLYSPLAKQLDGRYDIVIGLRPNRDKAVATYYTDLNDRWAVTLAAGKIVPNQYGQHIETIYRAIEAAPYNPLASKADYDAAMLRLGDTLKQFTADLDIIKGAK